MTVFERADRIGGLLRYGIPEFKMEKRHLNRRIEQMEAEGTVFRTSVNVGVDITAAELREQFDAVVLAGGATNWRDLPIPGRELNGIYQAMEYLPPSNRVQEGDLAESPISSEGKHVVIIGGGDTGADCLGTAHRQGAASIHQFEIMARPPDERPDGQPVADVADDHAHELRRTKRAASACSPSTPSASSATTTATCAPCVAHEVEMVDGKFVKVEGSDFELPAERVLSGDGLPRPRARRAARRVSASSSTSART